MTGKVSMQRGVGTSSPSPACLDRDSLALAGVSGPTRSSWWIDSNFVMGQMSEHRNMLSDPRDVL